MKQPESMALKIRRQLILVGVIGVVLTAVGAALLFHRAFAEQEDWSLACAAQAFAAGYEADPGKGVELLTDYAANDDSLRVTLIETDGAVLYDSTGQTTLENHGGRPEVEAAIATKHEGLDTRRSATVGRETHYYALYLDDGRVLRLGADVRNIWSTYNGVLPILGVCCLLVLALAALLAFRLTHALVKPIKTMAENLDNIEAAVPYIELEPLARTVQSDRKLQQDNEAIRREFTANVSHELKTPLTSISGYAELIENGMAKPADVPSFAGRIRKEAARMIALVSDILQLSELDSVNADEHKKKSGESEMGSVDLALLVRDLAGQMTMNARKAYVTLQYQADPAIVVGNCDLLTELATNLCDNAIRYNRPGGHVNMKCGVGADGCAYLEVEDNGIGIPHEAQGRVFERFYRVDKSRSKATGGTGLGLAIVKHIALLHGARIDLKSQVGTGTTIRVTFAK